MKKQVELLGCNNCKMEKSHPCATACRKSFREYNKKKRDAIDDILIKFLGSEKINCKGEKMTVKEFLEKYNYAPYTLAGVAEGVCDIIDDEELAGTAKAFLEIKENLEMMLDNIGFEFG